MITFKFKIISITASGSHAFAEAFLNTGKMNIPLGLTGLLPLDTALPKPALQSFEEAQLPQGWNFALDYREIVDEHDVIIPGSGRNYFVAVQK